MRRTGSRPHAPHILLSASAEYQSAADSSHLPKLSQITLSDPWIVQNGLYCPRCVTPPLGKLAQPATFILSVQKALDDLQEKQHLLRKQLIFYWIELQLLHLQGVQCSKTHEVLTWGKREIANAIVHLTQYYGRLFILFYIVNCSLPPGRFPIPAHLEPSWPTLAFFAPLPFLLGPLPPHLATWPYEQQRCPSLQLWAQTGSRSVYSPIL